MEKDYVKEMVEYIKNNNLAESTDTFKSILTNRISQRLLETKRGIGSTRDSLNQLGRLTGPDLQTVKLNNNELQTIGVFSNSTTASPTTPYSSNVLSLRLTLFLVVEDCNCIIYLVVVSNVGTTPVGEYVSHPTPFISITPAPGVNRVMGPSNSSDTENVVPV